MHVLYVLQRFPVFEQTFVRDEIRGLLRAGDDVTVYSRRAGDPGVAGELLPLVIGPGSVRSVRGIGAALRMRERGAVHDLWEAAWLARQVRADHVHAHFAFGNATVALFYGRLTGVPASFTAHAHDLYKKVPPPVMRRKIAAASFVAAVSEHGAEHLRACADPADLAKIVVQRNGIARDAIDAGEPESPPRIVAVARHVEKKGLDVLVRAAGLLAREVVLELVGEGHATEELRELGRDLGVRLLLPGPLPHEQALQRLVGASVFALPCRELASGDRDGMPVAIVEAMSAGVPVVSTPVAGIPELVRDGETGLLVPSNDPPALAAALGRVLADRALRDRLGAAGRVATEPWDRDRCTATLRARFS